MIFFYEQPIYLKENKDVNYHRKRLWLDGFFPVEEPIYSRSHDRLGRSHPR